MYPKIPEGWRPVLDDEVIQHGDKCAWGRHDGWDIVSSSPGYTPSNYHGGSQLRKGLRWITNRPPPVKEEKEWLNLCD